MSAKQRRIHSVLNGRLPGKGDRMLKHAIGSKNGARPRGSRSDRGDGPHPVSTAVAADPHPSSETLIDRVSAVADPRS
jgi:hypothetical protein